METRLTYPVSIRLLRAARADGPLSIEGPAPCDGWHDSPRRPDRMAAMLAEPGDSHALDHGEPLPLLSADDRSRTRAAGYASRILESGLPHGSLVRIARPGFDPVAVESPELCVVRASADLSHRVAKGEMRPNEALLRVVSLVDELAGRYVRDPRCPHAAEPCAYDVEPVTSVAAIERFLAEAPKVDGLRLARRAVGLATDNLGSPLEALLATLLCSPPRLGGANLPRPACNRELDLERFRRVVSHGTLRPDLAWPGSGLVVEVNGRVHDTPEGFVEDARRVTDYQAMGLTVFVARSRTIYDRAELDRLILNIATALSKDGRPRLVRTVSETLDSQRYRQARELILKVM